MSLLEPHKLFQNSITVRKKHTNLFVAERRSTERRARIAERRAQSAASETANVVANCSWFFQHASSIPSLPSPLLLRPRQLLKKRGDAFSGEYKEPVYSKYP